MVAFRGSSDAKNAVEDIDAIPKDFNNTCSGCFVDQGFYLAYDSIKKRCHQVS